MIEYGGHTENCFWYAESQAEENMVDAKGAEWNNDWFDEACEWALIYLSEGTSTCQCEHTS